VRHPFPTKDEEAHFMVFYNLPNWTGVTVDLRFAVAAKQWLDQQGIVYV
jgi:hypothetical protein